MTQPEQPNIIRVSDLSKSFGRKHAVDGMSFSVPAKAVAGFLGPNGAGKTTTLRMLLGLIFPDHGSMEMLGTGMPSGRMDVLEKTGALVEQPTFIESMCGAENLSWFGSLNQPVSASRISEVLERVGLTEAARQSFGTYSTGMKQRLGVAFAILHRPTLLILDEPTSGMDPQGRAQMRDILREIHAAEGTSIFLSSHLLDEVQRLCDYVVIVDHGKTVREGFVSQLLKTDQECWEVRLPSEEQKKGLELVSKMDFVIGSKPGPRGLELDLKPGTSARLNKELVGAGLTVNALIPMEASLEATFLALTDNSTT